MPEKFDHILTNKQCLELIEKAIKTNQFELLNYSLNPLGGEKKGYFATHLRGTFNIRHNGNTRTLKFFMKLKSPTSTSVAKLSDDQNDVYIRESIFLKLVTNDFQVTWAPKFYDFIDNKLVVLEDLSERGFKVADSEEYDLNHCHVGLNTLARFHAFSFKYLYDKRLENEEYSILKEFPYFFIECLYTNEAEQGRKYLKSAKDCISFMINEIKPKNLEKIQMKFNEEFDRLADALKPMENKYHVISHGDFWFNNIMFSYENNVPKECCMIDYQILRFIPPTFDLQFFLTVNTTANFRKKHFHELLEYYYQQLSHQLNMFGLNANDIYPKEIYEKHCADLILLAMVSACDYKTVLLIPRPKYNNYMLDPFIGEQLTYGDRTKYMKEEMEINDVYKQKMFEQFQELIDKIEELL